MPVDPLRDKMGFFINFFHMRGYFEFAIVIDLVVIGGRFFFINGVFFLY